MQPLRRVAIYLVLSHAPLAAQAPTRQASLAANPSPSLASFTSACGLEKSGPHRELACGTPLPSVTEARAAIAHLPDGGDWGMPDAWSALAVARTQFVLAGPTAWGDSAWDDAARLHRRPAINAVLRAIELRPGFLPALILLHDICPYPQLWAKAADELKQLHAVPLTRLPPALYATRVMLELETGHDAEAAATVDSLRIVAPNDVGVLHLAAVLAAHTASVPKAWQQFLVALNAPGGASPEGWPAYEALLVADSVERDDWFATEPSGRAQWLREFWESRDQEIAAIPGMRWVEHQRRWITGLQSYRVAPDGGVHDERRSVELMVLPPTMVTDPDPSLERADPHRLPKGVYWDEPRVPGARVALITRRVLDDRGLSYLRHGEPQQTAVYVSRLLLPDLGALASDRSGNPMRYGASASDSVPFFQPVVLNYTTWRYEKSATPLILSFGQLTTASPAMWAFDFPRGGDLGSPCHLDPRFCSAILSVGARSWLRRESHEALVNLAASDDADPRVRHDAGLITEAYALAGGGVLVVYAVPADSVLVPKSSSVTLRFAVSAMRPGAGFQQRIDTTRTFRLAGADAQGRFLSGWFELPGRPGAQDLTVSVFTADSTIGSIRRHPHVDAPEFDGKTLAISAPIFGREDADLTYDRHGEPVVLNPTNAWRPTEPATVYFEVDGLVVGHDYETRYEFWKDAAKAREPQLTLSSTDRAADTVATRQQALGLAQLPSGAYRVVVNMRDLTTEKSASATGFITIVK